MSLELHASTKVDEVASVLTRQQLVKVKNISGSEAKQYQVSACLNPRFRILTLLISINVKHLISTQRSLIFLQLHWSRIGVM